MRMLVIGAVLLGAGLVAIVTGVLPGEEALALVDRVWPILLFVVSMTVVTEIASEAGVFTVVAEALAKLGRGSAFLLWLLVCALAVICTILLSLDTTAVLLTPVVLVLARHVGLSPLPFAFATVWLANTASLLLPVSNLTNLLAQHRLAEITGDAVDPGAFAALLAPAAIVAILVPIAILAIVHRRDLRAPMRPGERTPVQDRVLLIIASVTILALVPALVSGIEVWIPATIAAALLVIAQLVRRPSVIRLDLLPIPLVVFASGLFVVLEAAHALGLSELLRPVVGEGDSPLALLRMAMAGTGLANVADNLPAYLALEPLADSAHGIAALLVGVNAGPLITPWASLATLLWHARLRAEGVEISWWRYAALGLVAAPVTVGLATLALSLTA